MATSPKEERDASDWDAMPDEEFRRHIQDFVQTHCPADLRFMSRRSRDSGRFIFYPRMAEPLTG
ncbi:MAG TPA: hypothetical protein VN667_19035 [Burkholderiales bacterium]|nr:hypothetical protein [Burkholderiales bacterium]